MSRGRRPEVPIVVHYTPNVEQDEYDAIVSHMRFHDEPPEGLIMHTAAVTDEGRVRVFDVWASREAHDRFAEGRLRPAIVEVIGDQRADGIAPEVHRLHSLVRPVGG